MNIYQEASKRGLRFNTEKGVLSVEQLWSLSFATLGRIIKAVKEALKKSGGDDDLAFLNEDNKQDTTELLRFEILKDVYLTKQKENEELRNAASVKEYNQKILSLIQEKKEDKLKGLSVEELEALLKV